MSIFRAYDIRGIYPTEITEELAEKTGKAFGTFLPEKPTVAVGGDVRTSTPALKEKLTEGLLSTGAKVIDIGMVTTPMLYFAVARYNLDGGINTTASHNPPEYNGFKIVGKGGICLNWETGINDIKKIIDSDRFRKGKGSFETKNIEEDYISHLLRNVAVQRKLKVVLDAANGACSLIAPALFRRLGWDVVPLFCEPDGRFPNHEADPVKKKNLIPLQEKVKETGADLGISYDADGDRMGVVNEKGQVVENNTIFSLFIKDTLERKPKSAIVYEVVVSKMVEDTIKKYGGQPVLSRVGHSYIHSLLHSTKAALGGENSGHYYFPENFGFDDALFASLKAAELLNNTSLSEREKEIPSYLSSEELRPFCADDRKFGVVEAVQEALRSREYDLLDIDGARVVLDKGWFIIRASNTGPQLVVRWEAEDQSSFEKISSLVREQLEAVGVTL